MAQIEESVARYLQQLDSADRQGQPTEALQTRTSRLKEKIEKLKQEMRRLAVLEVDMLATPDQQISLTDPDARSMATSGHGSGVDPGYNVQVAVEAGHHLIVTHDVTNDVVRPVAALSCGQGGEGDTGREDSLLLSPTAATSTVIGDPGACEEAGIMVTLPKPMTSNSKAEGRFGKQDFRYVAEEDVYVCPAGAMAHPPMRYTTDGQSGLGRSHCYATNAKVAGTVRWRSTTAPRAWATDHAMGA